MIPIIIMILSILLDGLLTNYLPYLVGDLSLFTPLLTVVSIFIIYPFYRKKEKEYFITVFILGIIYDLLYTNLLFFNGVIFTLIGLISMFIHKNYNLGFIKIIIHTIVIIFFYETVTAILLLIYNIVPITLDALVYKLTHTILLNVIYIEIVYLIIKILPKRLKNISIN